MGDAEFISADPWGIPVEDAALDEEERVAPPEAMPEPEPTEAEPETEPQELAEERAAEREEAAPESVVEAEAEERVQRPVGNGEPLGPEPAAEAEEGAPESELSEPVEEEGEPEELVGGAADRMALEAAAEPAAARSVDEEAQQPESELVAWESELPPESRARGFSQMLAAALSSMRPREPAEAEEAKEEEEAVEVESSSNEDVLDETPAWMIEDSWQPRVDEEPEVEALEAPAESALPQEPEETEAVPAPGESALPQEPEETEEAEDTAPPEPDLEELVAQLAVGEIDENEVQTSETGAPAPEIEGEQEEEAVTTEPPEQSPEVFRQLEGLSEEAAEPVAAVTEQPEERRIVAASPGVEWGSRWRETAQGWVEEPDGRSTWRPIVATSSSLAQWDVDTYLGVVAGDAVASGPGDPSALIAGARSHALQRMLDDAVARGAHAVVGASIAVSELASGILVTATGTAVTLQARD